MVPHNWLWSNLFTEISCDGKVVYVSSMDKLYAINALASKHGTSKAVLLILNLLPLHCVQRQGSVHYTGVTTSTPIARLFL